MKEDQVQTGANGNKKVAPVKQNIQPLAVAPMAQLAGAVVPGLAQHVHLPGHAAPPPSPGASSIEPPAGGSSRPLVPSEATTPSSSSSETDGEDDEPEQLSVVEACVENDTDTVRALVQSGQHGVNEVTEEGDTLLLIACTSGFYTMADMLIKMDADVEERGSKNDCTPLMEAAGNNFVNIVQLLLANKADVNAQSGTGDTALHISSRAGHERVVHVLVDAGANLEDQNENGHTPLMEAASAGHVTVAKCLLKAGAGINTHSNEFKESALTLACYKGHFDMVAFLLDAGADLDHKTDEMHTALMEASMDGHTEVAKLLLDNGSQVNMPADSFESPLTLAACGGHVELATLLLSHSANLEEVNDEGYTPLMEAAREGHEDMVALLLDKGAEINAQTDETQETALTLACCGGFLEVADYLLKKGANIELGCSTPLMEAAQEGHLDLVKHLLDSNANVHAETSTQDTALTVTTENGHTDVAALLIEHQAQVDHGSDGGRTPLMKAARGGHTCTLDYLIKAGATVNKLTTSSDHTALSLAAAGGHVLCVERLLIHGADPCVRLKDGVTALMEASRGGFTQIVEILLNWPTNIRQAQAKMMMESMAVDPVAVSDKDNIAGRLEHFISKVMAQSTAGDGAEGILGGGTPEEQEARKREILENLSKVEADLAAQQAESVKNRSMKNIQLQLTHQQQQAKMSLARQAAAITAAAGPGTLNADSTMATIAAAAHGAGVDQAYQALNPITAAAVADLMPIQQQQQFHQALASGMDPAVVQSMFMMGGAAPGMGTGKRPPLPLHIALQNHLQAHRVTEGNVNDLANALQDWDNRDTNSSLYAELKVHQAATLYSDVAAAGAIDSYHHHQAAVASTAPAGPSNLLANTLAASIQEQTQLAPGDLGAWTGDGSMTAEMAARGMFDAGHAGDKDMAQWEADQRYHLEQQLTQSIHQQLAASAAAAAAVASGQLPPSPASVAAAQRQMLANQQHLTPQQQQQFAALAMSGQLPNGPNSLAGVAGSADLNFQDMMGASSPTSGPLSPDPNSMIPDIPPGQQAIAGMAPGNGADGGPIVDVNAQTDSNNDTALTFSASGGHNDTTQALVKAGARTEHRDKKGFTPLILAATGGHLATVETLLEKGAQLEAVSDRTKDSALSLACSGGRFEVVELLLKKGANKEHRNVSDYTPLSLAASGGYVNIIQLLLNHAADINSRTGSKLGISPLMLAAMNGHTVAVKLLLDKGADINSQIETNRNTALTLACFQGRHEVVSLLVERDANIEHRAKTGLTPLMEAASGGYCEVGKVLLDRTAEVNAAPVPSSRDTALTIAADKGHYRFVELLIKHGANVNAKNKKGNSPLWLACSGGHLDVVQLLVSAESSVDCQDNRKVSCLMASFRKGHIKVVRWLVKHVNQFPSDTECKRFNSTISDQDLLQKCRQCMDIIVTAKERQAAEANKHASSLLKEIDQEKEKEERKKESAAKKRERKKLKKKEKQQTFPPNEDQEKSAESSKSNSPAPQAHDDDKTVVEEEEEANNDLRMDITSAAAVFPSKRNDNNDPSKASTAVAAKPTASRVGANRGSGAKVVTKETPLMEVTNLDIKTNAENAASLAQAAANHSSMTAGARGSVAAASVTESVSSTATSASVGRLRDGAGTSARGGKRNRGKRQHEGGGVAGNLPSASGVKRGEERKEGGLNDVASGIGGRQRDRTADLDDFESQMSSPVAKSKTTKGRNNENRANHIDYIQGVGGLHQMAIGGAGPFSPQRPHRGGQLGLSGGPGPAPSPGKKGKRGDDGWKEVTRKTKRVTIPHQVASRVLKQLQAVREYSKATIDVDKPTKSGDRNATIKGPAEATKTANNLLTALISDPDKTMDDLVPHRGGGGGRGGKGSGNHHHSNAAGGNSTGTQQHQANVPSLTSLNTNPPSSMVAGSAETVAPTVLGDFIPSYSNKGDRKRGHDVVPGMAPKAPWAPIAVWPKVSNSVSQASARSQQPVSASAASSLVFTNSVILQSGGVSGDPMIAGYPNLTFSPRAVPVAAGGQPMSVPLGTQPTSLTTPTAVAQSGTNQPPLQPAQGVGAVSVTAAPSTPSSEIGVSRKLFGVTDGMATTSADGEVTLPVSMSSSGAGQPSPLASPPASVPTHDNGAALRSGDQLQQSLGGFLGHVLPPTADSSTSASPVAGGTRLPLMAEESAGALAVSQASSAMLPPPSSNMQALPGGPFDNSGMYSSSSGDTFAGNGSGRYTFDAAPGGSTSQTRFPVNPFGPPGAGRRPPATSTASAFSHTGIMESNGVPSYLPTVDPAKAPGFNRSVSKPPGSSAPIASTSGFGTLSNAALGSDSMNYMLQAGGGGGGYNIESGSSSAFPQKEYVGGRAAFDTIMGTRRAPESASGGNSGASFDHHLYRNPSSGMGPDYSRDGGKMGGKYGTIGGPSGGSANAGSSSGTPSQRYPPTMTFGKPKLNPHARNFTAQSGGMGGLGGSAAPGGPAGMRGGRPIGSRDEGSLVSSLIDPSAQPRRLLGSDHFDANPATGRSMNPFGIVGSSRPSSGGPMGGSNHHPSLSHQYGGRSRTPTATPPNLDGSAPAGSLRPLVSAAADMSPSNSATSSPRGGGVLGMPVSMSGGPVMGSGIPGEERLHAPAPQRPIGGERNWMQQHGHHQSQPPPYHQQQQQQQQQQQPGPGHGTGGLDNIWNSGYQQPPGEFDWTPNSGGLKHSGGPSHHMPGNHGDPFAMNDSMLHQHPLHTTLQGGGGDTGMGGGGGSLWGSQQPPPHQHPPHHLHHHPQDNDSNGNRGPMQPAPQWTTWSTNEK